MILGGVIAWLQLGYLFLVPTHTHTGSSDQVGSSDKSDKIDLVFCCIILSYFPITTFENLNLCTTQNQTSSLSQKEIFYQPFEERILRVMVNACQTQGCANTRNEVVT